MMNLRRFFLCIALIASSTHTYALTNITAYQQILISPVIGAPRTPVKLDEFPKDKDFVSNYSEQLDYSTGTIFHNGTVIESGSAKTSVSFDLPRGEFKLYADSTLPAHGPEYKSPIISSTASIHFSDTLTVYSPTAAPTNPVLISFLLNTDGALTSIPALHHDGIASHGTMLSVASHSRPSMAHAYLSNACGYGDVAECSGNASPAFLGGGFATASAGLADGGNDEIMLRLPLYDQETKVDLSMILGVTSSQSIVDSSNTTTLSILAPHSTFTSETGLLMAPIPEPETYAMLLAGLGLIGTMIRRRKSRNP